MNKTFHFQNVNKQTLRTHAASCVASWVQETNDLRKGSRKRISQNQQQMRTNSFYLQHPLPIITRRSSLLQQIVCEKSERRVEMSGRSLEFTKGRGARILLEKFFFVTSLPRPPFQPQRPEKALAAQTEKNNIFRTLCVKTPPNSHCHYNKRKFLILAVIKISNFAQH